MEEYYEYSTRKRSNSTAGLAYNEQEFGTPNPNGMDIDSDSDSDSDENKSISGSIGSTGSTDGAIMSIDDNSGPIESNSTNTTHDRNLDYLTGPDYKIPSLENASEYYTGFFSEGKRAVLINTAPTGFVNWSNVDMKRRTINAFTGNCYTENDPQSIDWSRETGNTLSNTISRIYTSDPVFNVYGSKIDKFPTDQQSCIQLYQEHFYYLQKSCDGYKKFNTLPDDYLELKGNELDNLIQTECHRGEGQWDKLWDFWKKIRTSLGVNKYHIYYTILPPSFPPIDALDAKELTEKLRIKGGVRRKDVYDAMRRSSENYSELNVVQYASDTNLLRKYFKELYARPRWLDISSYTPMMPFGNLPTDDPLTQSIAGIYVLVETHIPFWLCPSYKDHNLSLNGNTESYNDFLRECLAQLSVKSRNMKLTFEQKIQTINNTFGTNGTVPNELYEHIIYVDNWCNVSGIYKIASFGLDLTVLPQIMYFINSYQKETGMNDITTLLWNFSCQGSRIQDPIAWEIDGSRPEQKGDKVFDVAEIMISGFVDTLGSGKWVKSISTTTMNPRMKYDPISNTVSTPEAMSFMVFGHSYHPSSDKPATKNQSEQPVYEEGSEPKQISTSEELSWGVDGEPKKWKEPTAYNGNDWLELTIIEQEGTGLVQDLVHHKDYERMKLATNPIYLKSKILNFTNDQGYLRWVELMTNLPSNNTSNSPDDSPRRTTVARNIRLPSQEVRSHRRKNTNKTHRKQSTTKSRRRKSRKKSTTKSRRKNVRKSHSRSATKSRRKSTTKSRRKSTTKSRRKSTTKSRRKNVRKSHRRSTTKSRRKSTTKSRRKNVRKSHRRSTTKSRRKSATKSRRKSTTKSRRKSTRKSHRQSTKM